MCAHEVVESLSTARTPDGAPQGLVQMGLSLSSHQLTVGQPEPLVKPASEAAHQPGQQPAADDDAWWCECPSRKTSHIHMPNWDADRRYGMIITALVDIDTGMEIPDTRR